MNRLRELRKERKLTQEKLASEIGVSKITILRWENGERQIKPDKAQALADYFGVSVGYLLGDEASTKTDSLSDRIFNLQLEIMKNIRKMEYKDVVVLEQITRDLNREAIIEQSRRYHVTTLFAKSSKVKNEI
ncbi:helix-turn-helix transcriptional regulator [Streptococcus suis]|nr:helix-turn-helix transcriptional regulator [Streptococcus suis]